MTNYGEALITLFFQHGYQTAVPLVLLTMLRPWAMLYTFIGFQWALGRSAGIRPVIALAIAAPMMVIQATKLEESLQQDSMVVIVTIVLAEVAVGACIGLLASLPFWSLKYAGEITDQMRGETDSGLQLPAVGSLTTLGNLYLVIGFLAFATLDGFTWLFSTLLESYQIWPTGRALPELTMSSLWSGVTLFGESIAYAVTIAFPALAVLLSIELISAICARLAPRFGFYNLAFLLRNLCIVMLLTLLVSLVWGGAKSQILNIFQDINSLAALPNE